MSSQPILPEAITDHQAFEQGFAYGEQAATNDRAVRGLATDEELNAYISRLRAMQRCKQSPDWYAGVFAGYRVTRSLP